MWGFLQGPVVAGGSLQPAPASFGIASVINGTVLQAAALRSPSQDSWDTRKLPSLELASGVHRSGPLAPHLRRSRSCSRAAPSPLPSHENTNFRLPWHSPCGSKLSFPEFRDIPDELGRTSKIRAVSWSAVRKATGPSAEQACRRQPPMAPLLQHQQHAGSRMHQSHHSDSPPPGSSKLPGLPRRRAHSSTRLGNSDAAKGHSPHGRALQGDRDFQRSSLIQFTQESEAYCATLACSVSKRQEGQFFNFLCDLGGHALKPGTKEHIPSALRNFNFLEGERSMGDEDVKVPHAMEFTLRQLSELRHALKSFVQASSPVQVVTHLTGSHADGDLIFRPTFCRFIVDSHLVSKEADDGRCPYHRAVSIFDTFAEPLRTHFADGSSQVNPMLRVCRTSSIEKCVGIIGRLLELSQNPSHVAEKFFQEGLPGAQQVADALIAEADRCAVEAAEAARPNNTDRAKLQRRIDIMVHNPPETYPVSHWQEGLQRWIEVFESRCAPSVVAENRQQQLAFKCFLDDVLIEPGCLHVCTVFRDLFMELYDTYKDERRITYAHNPDDGTYVPHMSCAAFFRFCLDFSVFPKLCSFDEVRLAYAQAECLEHLGKRRTAKEKLRRVCKKIATILFCLRKFGLLRWSASAQSLTQSQQPVEIDSTLVRPASRRAGSDYVKRFIGAERLSTPVTPLGARSELAPDPGAVKRHGSEERPSKRPHGHRSDRDEIASLSQKSATKSGRHHDDSIPSPRPVVKNKDDQPESVPLSQKMATKSGRHHDENIHSPRPNGKRKDDQLDIASQKSSKKGGRHHDERTHSPQPLSKKREDSSRRFLLQRMPSLRSTSDLAEHWEQSWLLEELNGRVVEPTPEASRASSKARATAGSRKDQNRGTFGEGDPSSGAHSENSLRRQSFEDMTSNQSSTRSLASDAGESVEESLMQRRASRSHVRSVSKRLSRPGVLHSCGGIRDAVGEEPRRTKLAPDLHWISLPFSDMSEIQRNTYALLRALADCTIDRFLGIRDLFLVAGEGGEAGVVDASSFLKALSLLNIMHEFDERGMLACMGIIGPASDSKLDTLDLEKAVNLVRDDLEQRRFPNVAASIEPVEDGLSSSASSYLGRQTWQTSTICNNQSEVAKRGKDDICAEHAFGCSALMESVLRLGIWHMHSSGVGIQVAATGGMKALWVITFLRHQFHNMLRCRRASDAAEQPFNDPSCGAPVQYAQELSLSSPSLSEASTALPTSLSPAKSSIFISSLPELGDPEDGICVPSVPQRQDTPLTPNRRGSVFQRQDTQLSPNRRGSVLSDTPLSPSRSGSVLSGQEVGRVLGMPTQNEVEEAEEEMVVELPPLGVRFAPSRERLLRKESLLLGHFAAADPDDGTGSHADSCGQCGRCRSVSGVGFIFCDGCSGVDDSPLSRNPLYPIIQRQRFRSEANLSVVRSRAD